MSGNGIPLMGRFLNGNTSDKLRNRRAIKKLVLKLFSSLDGLACVVHSVMNSNTLGVTREDRVHVSHAGHVTTLSRELCIHSPAVWRLVQVLCDTA